MIQRSFQLKVAQLASSVSLILLISYAVIVFKYLEEELQELVDIPLELIASVVLTANGKPSDQNELSDYFRAAWNMEKGSYKGIQYDDTEDEDDTEGNVVLIALRNPEGKLLTQHRKYYDERYWERVESTGKTDAFMRFGSDPEGNWEVRYYAYQGSSILLGLNRHDSVDAHKELMRIYSLSLPFAFLLVAAAGWIIARFAVRPIESMAGSVVQIEASSLHQRLQEASRKDEIGKLAKLINGMLERLERSYLQARRFTADASHEFKTPLAVIQAEIENQLRETSPEQTENHEALVRILDEVQRMKALTSSLLFLSKLDSEDFELKRETIQMDEILEDAIASLQTIADEKAVSVTVDDTAKSIEMQGDPSLMFQIMKNLLHNACSYNQPNGTIKIWAALKEEPDHSTKIYIGNTGIKIPKDQENFIFERFYRIEEHNLPEQKGHGLGLNIAKEAARLHGGDLSLFENNDGWIVFELTLPKQN